MLDYIRRCCMRHDTVVARAFRRALGMPVDAPRGARPREHASAGVYDGMDECFENRKRVRL